jgi:hypothetical protein
MTNSNNGADQVINRTTTPLFTLPVTKPERRCLKLAAAKAETSMADLVRRGIGAVLNEVSPEDFEVWESMQAKRERSRRVAA